MTLNVVFHPIVTLAKLWTYIQLYASLWANEQPPKWCHDYSWKRLSIRCILVKKGPKTWINLIFNFQNIWFFTRCFLRFHRIENRKKNQFNWKIDICCKFWLDVFYDWPQKVKVRCNKWPRTIQDYNYSKVQTHV